MTLTKIPRPIRDRLVTLLGGVKCTHPVSGVDFSQSASCTDRVTRATRTWHTLSGKERLSYLHTVHMAYLEELRDLAAVMCHTASSEE